MLGLHTRAGKEEIRQAYKEYVRENHPDLNGGKTPKNYSERFQRLTAAYNEVMEMSDDEFWLESFDTGITRMATKRVDGPSLNSWERRFRQWARANDMLEVDDLADEDVDCRKKAKLYLDRCEEDPTLEGCEMDGNLEPIQVAPSSPSPEDEPVPAARAEPAAPAAAAARRDPPPEDSIRLDQIFLGTVVAVAGLITLAFLSIVLNALRG